MAFRTRERLLALAAILVVGIFVADRLLVSPMIALWKHRSERIDETKKDLNRGSMLIDRADALSEQWRNMRENALANNVSVAEDSILEAVSRWVETSGLGISSLKPRWVDSEDGDYRLIECRISAQGGIAALARFLFELEADAMPLRVEEVEVDAREDNGQQLTLDLRFTGLVLTPEVQ